MSEEDIVGFVLRGLAYAFLLIGGWGGIVFLVDKMGLKWVGVMVFLCVGIVWLNGGKAVNDDNK